MDKPANDLIFNPNLEYIKPSQIGWILLVIDGYYWFKMDITCLFGYHLFRLIITGLGWILLA